MPTYDREPFRSLRIFYIAGLEPGEIKKKHDQNYKEKICKVTG
jgi:hypothetical protein